MEDTLAVKVKHVKQLEAKVKTLEDTAAETEARLASTSKVSRSVGTCS